MFDLLHLNFSALLSKHTVKTRPVIKPAKIQVDIEGSIRGRIKGLFPEVHKF